MDHERRYNLEKRFLDELESKYDVDGKFKEGFEFALKLLIAMEDEREKQSEEIVAMLMDGSNNFHTCTATERAFLDEIREKGYFDDEMNVLYIVDSRSLIEKFTLMILEGILCQVCGCTCDKSYGVPQTCPDCKPNKKKKVKK